MSVSLSHFGEHLVARMANELRGTFLRLCNLADAADRTLISAGEPLAYPEVKLAPYSQIGFDGASCIDMLVLLSADCGVPFEIKLGEKRLSKSRIDNEWLSGCGFSHGSKRFTGNMMSILERKFPESIQAFNWETLRQSFLMGDS